MKFDFREAFLIFIRGLMMGSVEIVPGVSAGTIAIVTGIYERLIDSISKISFSFVKPLFKRDFSDFKKKFFNEIDFELFIPLLIGMGIAVLSVSKLISYAMDVHTSFTYSFFFGLILASAIIFFRKLNAVTIKNILTAIIGFVFAFIFVSLNPIAANHTLPIVFISGFIAICAMMLPGISGSFLLLLLGQYDFMLNALHQLRLPEIITFIVGALIGILSFSRFLNYLLKHHEQTTMSLLIGVMLGTLRIPFEIASSSIALTSVNIILCLICGIVGLVIIVLLERLL